MDNIFTFTSVPPLELLTPLLLENGKIEIDTCHILENTTDIRIKTLIYSIISSYLGSNGDEIIKYSFISKLNEVPLLPFDDSLIESFILPLSNSSIGHYFTTNLNQEDYKYKEIRDDIECVFNPFDEKDFIRLDKNHFSKVFITTDSMNIISREPRYLSIQLFTSTTNTRTPLKEIFQDVVSSSSLLKCEWKTKEVENKEKILCNNKDFYMRTIYNDDDANNNTNIDKKMNNYFTTTIEGGIEKNTSTVFTIEYIKHNEKKTLIEKYKKMNPDTLVLLEENAELTEENIFFNKKIFRNTLSREICYWILNECSRVMGDNDWETCVYPNYETYLSIEKLPEVYSFVKFICVYYLNTIQKIYNIPDSSLNIKDIFICKYKYKEFNIVRNKDDCHFSINILLNNIEDFTGGGILFDDLADDDTTEKIEEKILKLHQGDMLIYTGKHSRSMGSVEYGEKYMLCFYVDLD